MNAVRGATTVREDAPDEIREAVAELLGEMVKRNRLANSDIICITFSSTQDIRSF